MNRASRSLDQTIAALRGALASQQVQRESDPSYKAVIQSDVVLDALRHLEAYRERELARPAGAVKPAIRTCAKCGKPLQQGEETAEIMGGPADVHASCWLPPISERRP